MTKLGDTSARFLWTPLCVCMVLACGKQALEGGELLEPDGGGAADVLAAGDDGPLTGGASGGGGGATGGGSGATPPSSGGAEGPSCSNAIPCGGDVVGTWTVTSSCLQVSGQLDMSMVGVNCTSAPVTGALQVTGTWTANADGTYVDTTSTQGEEVITAPASCQEISGTIATCGALSSVFLGLGYDQIECTSAATGGCTCPATIHQSAGIGLVSLEASPRGEYATSGNVLKLDSGARYSYCVSANQMSLTLLGTSPITTGTIVLQRTSTAGSGGSSGTGGASGTGGSSGGGGSTGSMPLPCDIYASEAGPCIAAHSTVRALLAAYNGPLYQVRRADGPTQDIPLLSPGGFADANVQDAFCDTSTCTISVIYDQSGKGNHLTKAPPGGAKATPGKEANATSSTATFGGHKVHGVYLVPGVGYRNNQAMGTATGDDPETIYMVASGQRFNAGCCFDYGNAETNNFDNGEGAVEAVYFGSCSIWGQGGGSGPWVMGDLENGLWPGSDVRNESNPSVTYAYVTAMVKGGPAGANRWAIKVGDAQSGNLATVFDGPRPSPRYQPMRKEGAIILGIGGDNSNAGQGIFFEGIMTAHFSSDAADSAAQASIVSAYGR